MQMTAGTIIFYYLNGMQPPKYKQAQTEWKTQDKVRVDESNTITASGQDSETEKD